MADIVLVDNLDGSATLVVNDVDMSRELFRDIELVDAGDGEAGLRVTLAVGSLVVNGADILPGADLEAARARVGACMRAVETAI